MYKTNYSITQCKIFERVCEVVQLGLQQGVPMLNAAAQWFNEEITTEIDEIIASESGRALGLPLINALAPVAYRFLWDVNPNSLRLDKTNAAKVLLVLWLIIEENDTSGYVAEVIGAALPWSYRLTWEGSEQKPSFGRCSAWLRVVKGNEEALSQLAERALESMAIGAVGRKPRGHYAKYKLTERQTEAVEQLGIHKTKTRAAKEMRISRATFNKHHNTAMRKLGRLATKRKPKNEQYATDYRGQVAVSSDHRND